MKKKLKGLTLACVQRGTVKLASGVVSDFYIDGRQVTLNPEGVYYIAHIMAAMLQEVEFEAVGGPTMGADPIIGALAYHLFCVDKLPVKTFIVRKETKAHGLQKMIEGPSLIAGDRVVMVEDVVTSGGSILKAIRAVEDLGCQVVKVLALVDREQGAGALLAQYHFAAIFTRRELEEAICK